MLLRIIFVISLFSSVSLAVPCKGECSKKCGSDKQELSGQYECPQHTPKCCSPRAITRSSGWSRTYLSYVFLSVCGIMVLIFAGWRMHAYFTADSNLNLRKYLWPHDSGRAPLPFKDLKFEEESQFINLDGKPIATFVSRPHFRPGNALLDPTRPRAVLLFVPPPGSHVQRYTVLPSIASGLGFATYALDHENFGKSGASGEIEDYEVLVRDVLDFAERIKEEYPDVLLFILGHGLGGTIASLCVHQNPHLFAGVVYVAPVLNPFWSKFQQALVRKLGTKFPAWRSRLVCWAAPDITSSNKAMETENLKDPMYHKGPISLGTALQILNLIAAARKCLPQTNTNLLLQQAGRDLVSVGSAKYLARSRAVIKDNFITKDAWHDILGSHHSEEIVSNILDWVHDRVQAVFLATTLD